MFYHNYVCVFQKLLYIGLIRDKWGLTGGVFVDIWQPQPSRCVSRCQQDNQYFDRRIIEIDFHGVLKGVLIQLAKCVNEEYRQDLLDRSQKIL